MGLEGNVKERVALFQPNSAYSFSPSIGHTSASLSCAQHKCSQLQFSVQFLAFNRPHISISLLCTAQVQSVILTARKAGVDDGHAFLLIQLYLFIVYCLFNGVISGWHRNWDSLVATDWTARGSNPGRAKSHFSSPNRPDRPLSPSTFLFNKHWALSQMDRDMKFTAQLNWIPKLRLSGATPLLSYTH